MRTEILFTMVLTVIFTVFCFIVVVILAMQMSEVIQFFKECAEYIFESNRNTTGHQTRRRRNAIYIYPQPPREIEMTPITKKNFIIIENPNSPYTLGVEYSSE